MKKLLVPCLAAALLLAAGCKDKPKEVPVAVRAEAAQHASEADFAVQIRDYTRARTLLEQAVKLDGEIARYWMQLGAVHKLMDNTSGARKAYEKARDLVQAEYRRDKTDTAPLLAEIEILLLLGREADARKLLDKAAKDHKDDRDVKIFVEGKVIDDMLANPQMKKVGL